MKEVMGEITLSRHLLRAAYSKASALLLSASIDQHTDA